MTRGITLALDGSTYAGSVALIRDGALLASRQLADAPKPGREGRAEHFMPMVAGCFAEAGIGPTSVERVVCGAGPGSFTSLRVAASIAKGIAVGANRPLFAVSSLMLIVATAWPGEGRWMATLPAMREEMFAGLFEIDGEVLREIGAPRILGEREIEGEAGRLEAGVLGAASDASQQPHAKGVARILSSIIGSGACDISAWEPLYGRLAEAQVKWEAAHGRKLSAAG